MSYIEIYNETLRDLLNLKKGPLKDEEKPAIHTGKVSGDIVTRADLKGKVYVDPLVENVVSTPQDVVDLLERGNTMRKVGATDWVSAKNSLVLTARMSGRLDRTLYSPLLSNRGLVTEMERTIFGYRDW